MALLGASGLLLPSAAILLAIYTAYLAIYRLFLSPLAKIPGPRWAALTYWYECYYDLFLPAQYVFKIKQLHDQYGPIVRITPDEVSIADPDFFDTIYAPGPGHKRDKDPEKSKALGFSTSIGATVGHDLHRKRREPLNPFFSHRSIARLAPKLHDKIQQLEENLARAAAAGDVVNLSDLYYAFANDIVNEYCFGHSQNLLADPPLAHVQRKNVDSVLRGVKFNLHFSWIRDLIHRFPPALSARFTPPAIRDMIRFRTGIRRDIDRVLNHAPPPTDKEAHPSTTDTTQQSVFTSLRDSPSLPDSEKSPQRLEDEATLLVMAGTQSTQLSLTIAHYHLLANPQLMARLRAELATTTTATPLSTLEKLPYLTATMQEAHRLGFGVTGRNPRVAPDENITYTDPQTNQVYVLPPGTSTSTSTFLVHANADLFPDPFAFDPDRWLGPAGVARRRYQLAFSRGPHICIGMHLANAEMAVALAAMARWDLRLFETGAEDVAMRHDYHILMPRLDSEGVRVRVLGRAG
ncbi:cytochrome P450 [Podospora appendiculata]|uniref:Cytochrome P450 n=1 Tax=Podospora appendiculata TaxID=314037 RepID=A0AAE0X9R2_9PEZI|nr:cytochrome P450 [Podospora appendiculata]